MSTTTSDKTDTIITYNYINDIVTAYAEVLQIQNDKKETLYTYTYGVQRVTNKKANDTTLYYQYDSKGSVIGQQNKNDSALHFKISYNDYGKPNRELNNEYGYNAEAHDYNGTQYLRARYYNTDTGRFDKRDSYRGEQNNPISQNRYTYVWNSPNQYFDKSGKSPRSTSSNASIHAFNALVDQERKRYPGLNLTCVQWLVAKRIVDNRQYHLLAYEHAKEVHRFFREDHGIPRCESAPPYQQPEVAENHNNSYHGGSSGSGNSSGVSAAEAARREAEKAIAEEKAILDSLGIKYDHLIEGMTLDEQLALLRRIKKICEEMIAAGKWDPGKAQEAADALVPQPKEEIEINYREVWETASAFLTILDTIFFWVAIIGSIIGLVSAILTLALQGVTVWTVASLVVAIAGAVFDFMTTIASGGSNILVKAIHDGAKILATKNKILEGVRLSIIYYEEIALSLQVICDMITYFNVFKEVMGFIIWVLESLENLGVVSSGKSQDGMVNNYESI